MTLSIPFGIFVIIFFYIVLYGSIYNYTFDAHYKFKKGILHLQEINNHLAIVYYVFSVLLCSGFIVGYKLQKEGFYKGYSVFVLVYVIFSLSLGLVSSIHIGRDIPYLAEIYEKDYKKTKDEYNKLKHDLNTLYSFMLFFTVLNTIFLAIYVFE